MSLNEFTHIRIIVGMILAISLARLVNGLIRVVQQPGPGRLDLVHLGWAAFLFITIIHFWWYEFYLSRIPQWTFAIYVCVVAYSLIFTALAALLFPDHVYERGAHGSYLEKQSRWFFGLLAASCLMDVVDTWIKGADYFTALGPLYVVRQTIFLAACIGAMRTTNRRYHLAFVAVALVAQVAWVAWMYAVLG